TAVTITCAKTDATNGCVATRTIVYTATDCGGNTKTCTQVISWTVDTTPPTITFCPANKTNECTGALVFGPAPTGSDPCGAVIVTVLTTVTNTTCGKTFVATRI